MAEDAERQPDEHGGRQRAEGEHQVLLAPRARSCPRGWHIPSASETSFQAPDTSRLASNSCRDAAARPASQGPRRRRARAIREQQHEGKRKKPEAQAGDTRANVLPAGCDEARRAQPTAGRARQAEAGRREP